MIVQHKFLCIFFKKVVVRYQRKLMSPFFPHSELLISHELKPCSKGLVRETGWRKENTLSVGHICGPADSVMIVDTAECGLPGGLDTGFTSLQCGQSTLK